MHQSPPEASDGARQAQTQGGEQDDEITPVDYLNTARSQTGVKAVAPHQGLDRLARQYLDDIVQARDLAPDAAVSGNQRALADGVARSIGLDEGFAYRHTGLMVGYGLDREQAVLDVLEDPATHPAMLDGIMDLAGSASRTVPPGEPWLAPPVGGSGPAIDLTGYTLVVIVTAGDY